MRILVAMDSFKGSLTSLEAGRAVKEGLLEAFATHTQAEGVPTPPHITVLPLADGGEGTVTALAHGLGGTLRTVSVSGPLGPSHPVDATYALLPGGTQASSPLSASATPSNTVATPSGTVATPLALMEIAQAAGLGLVPPSLRNPFLTTTYGVGQLIADALAQGCRRFIIGLGGSATNDGGMGMLAALASVPQVAHATFRIACDVTNPLCGPNGASAVFGPQKGATSAQVELLDRCLYKWACHTNGLAHAQIPGTGAAGGLGYAFLHCLHGTLEPGVDLIMDAIRLESFLPQVDLVITGEGKMDGQTVMGKAPMGVARLAQKYGKRVIAFCGTATPQATACLAAGIEAYYPLMTEGMPLAYAMEHAFSLLKEKVAVISRTLTPGLS